MLGAGEGKGCCWAGKGSEVGLGGKTEVGWLGKTVFWGRFLGKMLLSDLMVGNIVFPYC